MTKVLYAGSFDPITNGHLEVIKEASSIFELVYISVGNNTKKQYTFSINDRRNFIEDAVKNLPNVKIITEDKLTAQLANELQVDALLRGIRNGTDLDYELAISDLNQTQAPQIKTIFLPSNLKYRSYSSSMIKEIARYHGNLDGLVTKLVAKSLINKFN